MTFHIQSEEKDTMVTTPNRSTLRRNAPGSIATPFRAYRGDRRRTTSTLVFLFGDVVARTHLSTCF